MNWKQNVGTYFIVFQVVFVLGGGLVWLVKTDSNVTRIVEEHTKLDQLVTDSAVTTTNIDTMKKDIAIVKEDVGAIGKGIADIKGFLRGKESNR